MAMNQTDLDLYLLMIQRRTIISKANAKFRGGTDMSKELDQFAVKAINQYHNEQ